MLQPTGIYMYICKNDWICSGLLVKRVEQEAGQELAWRLSESRRGRGSVGRGEATAVRLPHAGDYHARSHRSPTS